MKLSDTPLLFAFEIESSEDFAFIPMIVRFHLDRCGLRLSLDQWQWLPHAERRLLARFPAEPEAGEGGEEDAFAQTLATLIATHAGGEIEHFTPEAAPAWADVSVVPPALIAQCALAALPAPEPARWAALAPFVRYVLAKLSRKPKLNHDFVPAMREFGLAGA